MASLLDGKTVAQQLKQPIKKAVADFIGLAKRAPSLAVILVGNDAASKIYVNHKNRACNDVGIRSDVYYLSEDTSEAQLLDLIAKLNQSTLVDGILVQLPLPEHILTENIIEMISPHKDVDGFHPYNIGKLAQRPASHPECLSILRPCTPMGIMHLLEHYLIPIQGQHAVVVGASNIVGRPMALELLRKGATVSICHRYTVHLEQYVRMSDLLIIATGIPDLIHPEWLNEHHVVVDVGIHRLDNGRIRGDINFIEASKKVAWITPVPGGVGPMTIISLLQNTLIAAKT